MVIKKIQSINVFLKKFIIYDLGKNKFSISHILDQSSSFESKSVLSFKSELVTNVAINSATIMEHQLPKFDCYEMEKIKNFNSDHIKLFRNKIKNSTIVLDI